MKILSQLTWISKLIVLILSMLVFVIIFQLSANTYDKIHYIKVLQPLYDKERTLITDLPLGQFTSKTGDEYSFIALSPAETLDISEKVRRAYIDNICHSTDSFSTFREEVNIKCNEIGVSPETKREIIIQKTKEINTLQGEIDAIEEERNNSKIIQLLNFLRDNGQNHIIDYFPYLLMGLLGMLIIEGISYFIHKKASLQVR